MRSIFLLFIFLFSITYFYAQSTFKAGLLGGISASQVHGDTYWGFDKAGIVGGGFVKKIFNEKWDAKFEIIYIEKGSKKNPDAEKGDYVFYHLKLNYMEVPMMMRWHHKKMFFEIGASLGTLIKSKEMNEFGLVNNTIPFRKADTSVLIGLSYEMSEHIEINFRNINSLLPVRKFQYPLYYQRRISNLFNKGMYNNVITLCAQYQF